MISIIVCNKNRSEHFIQTFPSMITMYGVPYELVIVDFHSEDDFEDLVYGMNEAFGEIMSPYLSKVRYIRLDENLKYNPRKAKNLGAKYAEGDILAFTDADVILGMNYLEHVKDVDPRKQFVATRIQDTYANYPKRLAPEINYGNCLVSKIDFERINGWDEGVDYYGGDDDDFYHRLKLSGLREINPKDAIDAKQYSIIHGDEQRLTHLEDTARRSAKSEFEKIYSNKMYENINNDFYYNDIKVKVKDYLRS